MIINDSLRAYNGTIDKVDNKGTISILVAGFSSMLRTTLKGQNILNKRLGHSLVVPPTHAPFTKFIDGVPQEQVRQLTDYERKWVP
jgi:hypothetical protein